MNFEPQKLFVGLIDFFAILLPGAILTFLFADGLGPSLLGKRYEELDGGERAVAFFIASYLAGHFVFLASSVLLDDLLYDRVRSATPAAQVRRLAEGKRPASAVSKQLARFIKAASADAPLRVVVRLRDESLGPIGAERAINTFQWAKARLALAHNEASVAVQRYEADSKFFRSLVIVMALVAGESAASGRFVLLSISVALAAAAFVRYLDQRLKATRQAYWFLITIAGERAARDDASKTREPPPSTPPPAPC